MVGRCRYNIILPDFYCKVNEREKKERFYFMWDTHFAVLPKIPPGGMENLLRNLANAQLTF